MSDEQKAIASLGKTERAGFQASSEEGANNGNDGSDAGGGTGAAGETEEAKAIRIQQEADDIEFKDLSPEERTKKFEERNTAAVADKNKLPELSAEQTNALLKKILGDDFDGDIEATKAKIKSPATVLSPEDKIKLDAEWDKRQLDVYIEAGGTIENYSAMKAIVDMDLRELSISEIKKQLKAADFNDEEISVVLKAQYFQLNPEEIVQREDELDADFDARKKAILKQIAYGNSQVESIGAKIKKQAEANLGNLRKAIEQSESKKAELEKEETQFLSNVDKVISEVPKTFSFELGMANDVKIEPVEHKVDADDIAEVQAILKDASQRTLFTNPGGTPNVQAITDVLMENRNLKKVAKVAYLEGGSRQVALFEKVFPGRSALEVGLKHNNGNVLNGGKTAVTKVGKSQRVQPV